MIAHIKELFFRISLYCKGVAFYEIVNKKSIDPPFFTKEYGLLTGHKLILGFSRVLCEDYLLKRGKLSRLSYRSYEVSAHIEGDQIRLDGFSQRRFFFNSRINQFGTDERRMLEIIADIYIDFAKNEILA